MSFDQPVISRVGSVLVHDGSFEGFLSSVFEATRLRLRVERIESEPRFQPTLFEEVHPIQTDPDSAERVWNGIVRCGGLEVAAMVRGAYLSESPGAETVIWQYLSKLFADKTLDFARNILDEHAMLVYDLARKVRHEAHLLTGFVRFQQSPEGPMFAVIDPDHNVVGLLAPHFSRRFPNMDWMIIDSRRGIGIHYSAGEVHEVLCPKDSLPRNAQEASKLAVATDDSLLGLWKCYYNAINIKERKNSRLMVRLLPRKYWKYLPERA